jgi:hypothetical protein
VADYVPLGGRCYKRLIVTFGARVSEWLCEVMAGLVLGLVLGLVVEGQLPQPLPQGTHAIPTTLPLPATSYLYQP